ncbi:MAG: thiosulfate oxidation carrier protein SoxY, partial [Hydrogenophilales bacterium CG15_BIG_FIL_POST_REV_8_21_14_020_62_31]
MNHQRRQILKGAGGVAMVAAAASAGLLKPG